MSTLLDFRYRRHYKAAAGKAGSGNRRTGHDGEDITLLIPCGTAIFNPADDTMLGDLLENGQKLLLAAGGRGGKHHHRE